MLFNISLLNLFQSIDKHEFSIFFSSVFRIFFRTNNMINHCRVKKQLLLHDLSQNNRNKITKNNLFNKFQCNKRIEKKIFLLQLWNMENNLDFPFSKTTTHSILFFFISFGEPKILTLLRMMTLVFFFVLVFCVFLFWIFFKSISWRNVVKKGTQSETSLGKINLNYHQINHC